MNAPSEAAPSRGESLREIVMEYARLRIEQGSNAGVCNYIAALLPPAQARRFGMQNVNPKKPGLTVIANGTHDKDAFFGLVARKLWDAGAQEICFLSDVYTTTRLIDDTSPFVAPVKDPKRREAWLGVYLSRTEEVDGFMLVYEGRKVVDEIPWGNAGLASFTGPLMAVLQETLFDALMAERIRGHRATSHDGLTP